VVQLDIPPHWVLVAAKRAMNETNHWSDCLDVLAAYYGVPNVTARVEPSKVSSSATACYVREKPGQEPMIYTKEDRISADTAFHEFGHHLQATLLKGRLSKQTNEHFAEAFAEAMVKVWESV
jgi:hypothetical protein